MADVLELLIRAATSYDGGLSKVADALKSIQNATGLSSAQLKGLEAEFQRLTAQGLNFKQAIASISSSGNNFGTGVGAAAKQIQTSLNQAVAGLQNAAANPLTAVKNSAVSLASSLGPVGIGIAAVGTVAIPAGKALFDFVDAQGRAAQETVNMAAQLGISAGQMKLLQVEAQLIGVSFQSMQIAARTLANALEDPTGAGKRASAALHDLGVTSLTMGGQVRQEGAIFEDVIQKLGGMTDHTKEVEEATRLFGARGAASLQLVIQRYQELDEIARNLGYGDTTQLQEALAKGEEQINAMRAAWDLFEAKLAEKIAPIVIPVVTRITAVADGQSRNTNDDWRQAGGWGGDFDTSNSRTSIDPFAAINSSDIGGLHASNLFTAQDQLAGQSISRSGSAAFNRSADGLSARISDLNQTIKELRDKQALNTNEGTLSSSAAADISTRLAQAESEKASAEAQKKALEEAASKALEIQRHFEKIAQELAHPALIGGESFGKAQANLSENLGLAGGNASFQRDAQSLYSTQTDKYTGDLYAKAQEEVQKKLTEAADKTAKAIQALGAEFDKAAKKLADDEANLAIDVADKQAKLKASDDKASLSLQRSSVLGYAKLHSGGETSGTAQLEGSFGVSSITESTNEQVASINSLIARLQAGSDQSFEVEKKISDLVAERDDAESKAKNEIAKLELDTALKVAEIQKKSLDEYKQQAGQIFDALQQPGGRGMQQWLRGQGNSLAKGVFSNATAPILQQLGHGIGGATSGLPPEFQSLFKGTMLDSARAKSPQIDATDKNTSALHALTSAITGKPVAGDSASVITPAPGSLAGNAAGMGGPAAGYSSLYSPADSMIALSKYGGASGTAPLDNRLPGSTTLESAQLASLTKALAPGGLLSFQHGATSGIGNWDEIFHSDATDAQGNTYSGAARAGAITGTAGAIAGGTAAAVNQFSQGTTAGDLGGLAAVLGTGAVLDPEPDSKAALAVAATFSAMFASILDQGVLAREAKIANQQAFDTYVPPPTLNRSLSASGGFEQINDKYGQPSATTYSSVAIEAPYKYQSPIKDPTGYLQNWETAPGQVIEPYQAAAAQPNWMTSQAPVSMTYVSVSTMDSQSFLDNSGKIAAAVQKEVVAGHPVGSALQRAVLGN